ncbi:hypothetical protein MRX96_050276 [Rhipicephalus microplus]
MSFVTTVVALGRLCRARRPRVGVAVTVEVPFQALLRSFLVHHGVHTGSLFLKFRRATRVNAFRPETLLLLSHAFLETSLGQRRCQCLLRVHLYGLGQLRVMKTYDELVPDEPFLHISEIAMVRKNM